MDFFVSLKMHLGVASDLVILKTETSDEGTAFSLDDIGYNSTNFKWRR